MLTNKQNNDGSVNSYQDTGKLGTGYYVPFTDPTFVEQIEPNIFLAVFLLNAKGYKTVSSCQGHSVYDKYTRGALRTNAGPQVTVEVPCNQVIDFVAHFKSYWVTTEVNDSIDNKTNNCIYISVRSNPIISSFFTNRFLCKKIAQLCETLPL